MKKFITASILLSSILFSKTYNLPSNNTSLKMVVTNKNIALVEEKREIVVDNGINNIIFNNVPYSIDTDSIITKIKDGNGKITSTIITQTFNKNGITQDRLLTYNLGKDILYKIYKKDKRYKIGKLVSLNPIMIKRSDNTIVSVESSKIIFKHIDPDFTILPNMKWKIYFEKPGKKYIDLIYLTKNINWSSDYTLLFNEKNNTLDLSSFITIKNRSGKSYKNVELKCLAGDINIYKPRIQPQNILYKSMSIDKSVDNRVKEDELSGYHIYNMPFKVDINNNENTQILFLDKKNIPSKKINKVEINLYNMIHKNEGQYRFNSYIVFNSKDLNSVLPQGKVKMYQNYKDNIIFIGGDYINNTSLNEDVKLKFGTNFDLKLKYKLTHLKQDNTISNISWDFILNNGSKKQNRVEIKIPLTNSFADYKFKSSCSSLNNCIVEKGKREIIFKINIKPLSKIKIHNDLIIYRK